MTPKSVVNLIEKRLGITGSPCEVRDAIELVLLGEGMAAATAAEETDRLRSKVIVEIERRRDERAEAGEVSILWMRIGTETVHGSSFVFTDDTPSIRQSKLNRISVDEIHSYVRTLDFNQFEVFGSRVLHELGCHIARVTPHAGDQGIDFFGKLTVGTLLKADPAILKLMHETQVIVLGQAKHYPNKTIGPSTVRELVGAMSLSRTSTFSSDALDLFDEVDIRPFSPVMAILFSTGDFTSGARHLAKRAGLIVFSGWQLAVFLADRGVGLVADGVRMRFDASTFDQWLAS